MFATLGSLREALSALVTQPQPSHLRDQATPTPDPEPLPFS